jgi:hypothetical protein
LRQTITDTELALYFIGNGAPPNQTRFSSSVAAGPHSQLSNPAVSNRSVSLPAAIAATVRGSTTVANPLVDSSSSTKVYDGIVDLDAYGQAEIALPSSFNLLIRDIRYQLTPLGAYAPLFIASELNGNTFRIGGGTPGLRVSWSVTGTLNNLNAK